MQYISGIRHFNIEFLRHTLGHTQLHTHLDKQN